MHLPPLVDPAPALTTAERRRYARQLLLPEVGEVGQRRLKAARVLVVGAGGLGSPALLYLAAAGVGTLGVVDDDVVEESNLHRQVVHGSADVGRAKVDSAADALAATNPLVRVVRHRERMTPANADAIVDGYDLVLDGSDTFATRYVVNDACVRTGTPWVWGAVLRFDGQAAVFWPGRGPVYRDVFPVPPPPGTVPSCGEAGVLGGVCAAVGAVMVTEAVKVITGAGRPAVGRVLVLDALAGSWRSLEVRSRSAPGTSPRSAAGASGAGERAEGAEGAVPADGPPGEDLPETTVAELAAALAGPRPPSVVDVREADEHAAAAIPGALLVPLASLDAAALPEGPVVLHCAAGHRSATALRRLRQQGRRDVTHLAGGMAAWVSAGEEVVGSDRAR
ncbi:molybdopterin-synthase adenylyltransferase MoeB [Kineococcus sp. SYSU DK004]|uniref:molybdopterin-synthase adenylyltransferase MoeB n=1 Tax=Kineococcus sp. SYSU DK004 TaxID=3383125 RepID=UPI003D7E37A6